jgi:hypothetical protein
LSVHSSTEHSIECSLGGRKALILPSAADGLRGPARTIAITAEARVLADAIVARLDRIDLFEEGLLVDGGLRNLNGELLRKVLRDNFATKHLVQRGSRLEVEHRPVETSELVIRTLLTAPPQDGGLTGRLGRLPKVQLEPPRQTAVQEPQVISNPIEHEAGQRALRRHADLGNERLREEIEAGQQALARHAGERP